MKYTVQIEINTDGGLTMPSFTADPETPAKLLRNALSRISDNIHTDTDQYFRHKYANSYPSPTEMDEQSTSLTIGDLYPPNMGLKIRNPELTAEEHVAKALDQLEQTAKNEKHGPAQVSP